MRELVMLVDDDPDFLGMCVRRLGADGFDVAGFPDPGEALDFARRNPLEVALLVTDREMPGMSGVELAGALRALLPALPVLVLSGGREPPGLASAVPGALFRRKGGSLDPLSALVAGLLRTHRSAR
jgi:FixJ family two-component response regulator